MSEVEALQPWQIFCSMFALFWLFSAWCDQVLITLLLCIVFGVLSDVITKSMYSSPSQEGKAERQASAEEKKESNEKIWRAAEAQLEEDEEEGEDTTYESLEATQSERRHNPPDVVTPRSLNPNLESYA